MGRPKKPKRTREQMKQDAAVKLAEHKQLMSSLEEAAPILVKNQYGEFPAEKVGGNELGVALKCARCKQFKKDCICGRPSVVTDQVLAMLREVYKLGCTDEEACAYAGISVAALQRYFDRVPQFRQERANLQELPVIKARSNIISAISEKNVAVSQWYMERKRRKEFGDSKEIDLKGTITHGVVILPPLLDE